MADNYFYKNNGRHFDRDDSRTYNLGVRYDFGPLEVFGAYQYGDNVEKVGNQMKRVSKSDGTYYFKHVGFDSNAVVVGATAPVLGGRLKFQTGYAKGEQNYYRQRVSNSTITNYVADANVYQFALAYDYPLSKRTYLYAAGAYVHRTYKVDGVKSYDDGQSDVTRAAMFGISHSF